ERAAPPRLSGVAAPMTDFLTRMARSALGLMPVAKVLAASRYAPEPEQGLPELPEQTLEQQSISEERPVPRPAKTDAVRPRPKVMRRPAAAVDAAPKQEPIAAASTPTQPLP